MKNIFILLTINFLAVNFLFCQDNPNTVIEGGGSSFGAKGGLTMGMQRWNGADASQTLPSYHGAIFAEFYQPWKANAKGKLNRSIFGIHLGYHRKGSAVRARYVNAQNQTITTLLPNEFHNICLMPYLKIAYQTAPNASFYYFIGVRAEYTARYNLLMPNISLYVNRFVAGVTLGAGYQWTIPKTGLAFFVEGSVSPDITRQIHVPAGIPVAYQTPDGTTQYFPSNEQKIVNLALEVSVGFKFSTRPRQFEPASEEEF